MAGEHPLEKMFALSAPSILDVIQRNNRLLMAVKGGIAQEHLRQYLVSLRDSREITDFGLLIEEGKPDFWVLWEGRNYFVECKNVQRTLRRGEITVDFMRTRYAKTVGPQGRFYKSSEFHVLAACLFNQTGKWEFRFIPTGKLAPHKEYRGRLDNKVSLGESTIYFSHWCADLVSALRLVPKG